MDQPKPICDLCEEKEAVCVMKNQVNGNKMKVCSDCYKDFWGK